MNMQPNPRVIGAFVIGFAMVAGAYVLSNFGKPTGVYQAAQTSGASQSAVMIRSAIPVTDEDANSIEDWRDEFIASTPIVVDTADENEPYTEPNTLTGQAGINFVQNIIRSRNSGGIVGGSDEEVIESTIRTLEQQTSVEIYDTPDVIIISTQNTETVRLYANAVATAILDNNQTDLDTELLILQDLLNRSDRSRLEELRTLAELYRLTRDAILDIPVPDLFVKEHLDLINTLHAVHNDVLGMTYSFDDPAYALLRMKRYEDDVLGMVTALENMYTALEPYANLFTTTDPAIFFVNFNPSNTNSNRIRI